MPDQPPRDAATTNEQAKLGTGSSHSGVPSIRDVLVGDLAQRGRWVVANIDVNTTWPTKTQKFRFRGEDIWIIPITQERYGALAIQERADLDAVACRKLLMRFISAISWVYEHGISLAHGFTGSTFPSPMGRPSNIGITITEDFDLSYCPEPADPRALLALALMREGRGLNHPGYAFLSFYRVLETAIPDGVKRGAWIKAKIPKLSGYRVTPAITKLRAAGVQDIGDHLYKSNRMAVAHAQREPIVDPDDYEELRRLEQELPIVIELATLAIEEVFGVETRHTVYDKHLYELAGWKKVIGPDIVAKVTAGEQMAEGTEVSLPQINVGLRDRAPIKPHVNMKVSELVQDGKSLIVEYVSPDDRIVIRFGLNFGTERLDFEILEDAACRDDGTADAIVAAIAHTEFSNAIFRNGQLHVWDTESGELLGRKDPYIPLNMFYDHGRAQKHLNRLRKEGAARREIETTGRWSAAVPATYTLPGLWVAKVG